MRTEENVHTAQLAVELLGFPIMREEVALQEAAAAGLKSMEHLIRVISQQKSQSNTPPLSHLNCRDLTDYTVSKFRKVLRTPNRNGHARFRRGPLHPNPSSATCSSTSSSGSHFKSEFLTPRPDPATSKHVPPANPGQSRPQSLTIDFSKPNRFNLDSNHSNPKSVDVVPKETFSVSPRMSMSSTNSSFVSTITGEGSVSNGKLGYSSMFLTPGPAPAVSAGKPQVSGKRCRKYQHDYSYDFCGKTSGSGRCHCKKRKYKVKKTIRVPAVSAKIADIPQDEFSWRKYGQKPIKGSPYPRGYYKCSTVRGCPARKHVERATDDPVTLIVTYEGEHCHTEPAVKQNLPQGNSTRDFSQSDGDRKDKMGKDNELSLISK